MQKTAVVAIERTVIDPVYGKRVKRIKKYPVHDEMETAVGQTVTFMASRPYSKTKKWIITGMAGQEKEAESRKPSAKRKPSASPKKTEPKKESKKGRRSKK